MKLIIYIKLLIYSIKNLFYNVIIIQNTKISNYIFLQNFIIFLIIAFLFRLTRIYTINIIFRHIEINFSIFFDMLLLSNRSLSLISVNVYRGY